MDKANTNEQLINISAFAKESGFSVQTIRYYESLGILPEPIRTESGYRKYSSKYLEHVRFAKNAQELGFKLEEIGDLVAIKFNQDAKGKDVKAIVKSKISKLEQEIAQLNEAKDYLQELFDSCSGKMSACKCPILNKMSQD